MELWGASLFGNPCRECGFDWALPPAQAVDLVRRVPEALEAATAGAQGGRRSTGWSVAEYVCHVGDNLRQWSERVQAARLAGQTSVGGYDPDELAVARGYESIPLEVALWSLRTSAAAWADVVDAALREGVVLDHVTRGPQRAEDIARNNAHDASHHLWDIRRILDAVTLDPNSR